MPADGGSGGLDELACEGGADGPASATMPGETSEVAVADGLGGGKLQQDPPRQIGVEVPQVARDLREAQVEQAVQLTLPVAQVLDEANAQAHQLAQLFGGLVARRDGGVHRGVFSACRIQPRLRQRTWA